MSSDQPGGQSQNPAWLRLLRPLLWWFVLVLALLAFVWHRHAMERTRLNYTLALAGRSLFPEPSVLLDGKPILSGQRISLGHHTLTISHPKAENFSTNFSAWYGGQDFGQINLQRAKGSLNVTANPVAQTVTISGPEFSLTLHDSTGTNILVPTDTYHITAQFARWSDAKDVVVAPGYSLPCSFTPQLGALSLTCNQSGATYVVRDNNGRTIENGDVPATLTGLPVDTYQMTVTFHQHELQKQLFVAPNKTNEVPFAFVFGSTLVLSTPAGASVYNAGGNYLGVTPLLVTELLPGNTEFKLQLSSHQDAIVPALVAADQTNTISTNLLSWAYLNGLQFAQHDFELGDFRSTLKYLEQALEAKPGDAEALALQAKAKARLPIQTAKELAGQGDYVGADKLLQTALVSFPDDGELKHLMTDYKTHETEQLSQQQEQSTRAVFDADCQKLAVARFFEPHEFVTSKKSPDDFKTELVRLYADEAPKAKVTVDRMPQPGVHEILFEQSSPNPLEMARREMMVVIGKGKNDQTLVLFKNFEYQRRMNGNTLNIVIGGSMEDNWVPLHSSQVQMTPAYEEQVKVGYRMMMRKVMKAVGETFVYTPN